MLQQLRSATREAHVALEDALGLLRPPLQRARFVRVLQGFHAFHRAWEPKVGALVGNALPMAPRGKLAQLESDLAALGGSPIVAAFDLRYMDSPSSGWGSLYVMEGSTLGGQVISKALRVQPWAPAAGLAYFNPYGRRTAAMWAQFRTALEAEADRLDPEVLVAGAQATFAALRHGLTADMEAAA